MIASQYKIKLDDNFDLNIIRERVKANGHKTDKFKGLCYKFYLLADKNINFNKENLYAPLYIWNESTGLNDFLFGGFYDNITNSFKKQNVNIGVPLFMDIKLKTSSIKYILESTYEIDASKNLNNFKDEVMDKVNSIYSYMVVYNPDKWKYNIFYLLDSTENISTLLKTATNNEILYEVLHISNPNFQSHV